MLKQPTWQFESSDIGAVAGVLSHVALQGICMWLVPYKEHVCVCGSEGQNIPPTVLHVHNAFPFYDMLYIDSRCAFG